MGVSLKRFSGWEPTTETVHEYDDAGRVVRTVTTTEPEWDEQERAWMLALAAFEDEQICPVCGGPKSICQAPENDGRFEVPPPTRCHVATAVAEARKPYDKARHPQALMYAARLRR